MAGVSLVRLIVEKTEESVEYNRNNGKTNIWYREDDGEIVFLGVHLSDGSVEVKSGTEQFAAADISSFNVDVGIVALTVETWDNDTFFIEYENIPAEYKFYVKDGALVIDREETLDFIWYFSFD